MLLPCTFKIFISKHGLLFITKEKEIFKRIYIKKGKVIAFQE